MKPMALAMEWLGNAIVWTKLFPPPWNHKARSQAYQNWVKAHDDWRH